MKTSLIKIVKSDFLAILCLMIPIVAIFIYIDSIYFNILPRFLARKGADTPINPFIFLIIAISTIGIFVPILILRIKKITDHFKNGIEVKGMITSINLWKDRGKIKYEYEIDGKSYQSGNAVHRSKFVNSLTEGEKVSIIVSKKNHNKALIKDMYFSE